MKTLFITLLLLLMAGCEHQRPRDDFYMEIETLGKRLQLRVNERDSRALRYSLDLSVGDTIIIKHHRELGGKSQLIIME